MNLGVALDALKRAGDCAFITDSGICDRPPDAHIHGPEAIVNLSTRGRPKMGVKPSCVGAHHDWVADPARESIVRAIEALPEVIR